MTAYEIASRATKMTETHAKNKFRSSALSKFSQCEDSYLTGYLTGSLTLANTQIIRLKRELKELKSQSV